MARAGSKRIYQVDDRVYATNLGLFGDSWQCRYCGEKFQKGDKIIAIYNNNIKWYHKKCYDLTLYDA